MDYVDEKDFTNEYGAIFEIKGKIIKKQFENRNIQTHLLNDKQEVISFIETFIKERDYINKIGFSDGVTLYQLGLFDWVKKQYGENGYDVRIPLERTKTGQFAIYGDQPPGRMNLPYEEYKEKTERWYENLRETLLSDLFIISANAITLDGEIISIDGLGNRVSGMIFGPRHVLCIVGRNKINSNKEIALDRIHNYTVPMTYLRHSNKHWANFQDVPCLKIGKCTNCSHNESSCRNTVIISGQIKQHADRIHLIIVNDDLGF